MDGRIGCNGLILSLTVLTRHDKNPVPDAHQRRNSALLNAEGHGLFLSVAHAHLEGFGEAGHAIRGPGGKRNDAVQL